MKKRIVALNFLSGLLFLMCLILGWHLGNKNHEMFTYLFLGFVIGSIIEMSFFFIGCIYLEAVEIKTLLKENLRRNGSSAPQEANFSSASVMSKLQKINSSTDPKADWTCKKCGESNEGKAMYCKNCGGYK